MTRAGGSPTGPRRPARDQKVKRVEFRLSPDELASLDELSSAWDVTRTEALRLTIDMAISALRRPRPSAKRPR